MHPTVGRRIVVYGWTGSGKTTTARRIGAALGLPVIEFDAIFWRRGNWQELPQDEFRAAAIEALDASPNGWVCDGNYSYIRADILRRADTVVWLRLPFRVTYWRLLKRTVRRSWTKEPLWGVNRESWRLSLLSRNSLLLWAFTQRRRGFRSLIADLASDVAARGGHTTVIELRSPEEVEAFLTASSASRSPGSAARTLRG
jgi:adenylate kinase family enzyme